MTRLSDMILSDLTQRETTMRMTRIYVAGPYTHGDTAANVRTALRVASSMMDRGYAPYVPHLTHFQNMVFPRPYEDWTKQDNEFLPCCDVLFRISGASLGSDREVKLAESLDIPVFTDLEELFECCLPALPGVLNREPNSMIQDSGKYTRIPSDQEARRARRATLTGHGRLVEDLADDFNEAVRSNDLQGFFERIAVRFMPDVRRSLETVNRTLDPVKYEELRNNIAKYLRGD